MMTLNEQKSAAKAFAESWKGRGDGGIRIPEGYARARDCR